MVKKKGSKNNRSKNNRKSESLRNDEYQIRIKELVLTMREITGDELKKLFELAKEDIRLCNRKKDYESIASNLGFTKSFGNHTNWRRIQKNLDGSFQIIGPTSSSTPKGNSWNAPASDFKRDEYMENVLAIYVPK